MCVCVCVCVCMYVCMCVCMCVCVCVSVCSFNTLFLLFFFSFALYCFVCSMFFPFARYKKFTHTNIHNTTHRIAAAFALRQRMVNFVQTLQYYMMFEVVEPQWHSLLEKLHQVIRPILPGGREEKKKCFGYLFICLFVAFVCLFAVYLFTLFVVFLLACLFVCFCCFLFVCLLVCLLVLLCVSLFVSSCVCLFVSFVCLFFFFFVVHHHFQTKFWLTIIPPPPSQVGTIDDVLEHHTNFLDTCLRECMLTSPGLLKVLLNMQVKNA